MKKEGLFEGSRVQASLALKGCLSMRPKLLIVGVQVGCHTEITKTNPTKRLGGIEERATSWDPL